MMTKSLYWHFYFDNIYLKRVLRFFIKDGKNLKAANWLLKCSALHKQKFGFGNFTWFQLLFKKILWQTQMISYLRFKKRTVYPKTLSLPKQIYKTLSIAYEARKHRIWSFKNSKVENKIFLNTYKLTYKYEKVNIMKKINNSKFLAYRYRYALFALSNKRRR
jgi:hypothetical protein